MNNTEQAFINHIQTAIYNAFHNISNLSDEVLSMHGMSGNKTRHLYNNICNLPNKTYLEVGTYTGSSLISALYKNNLKGYCVDNWQQFGGKQEFEHNLQSFAPYLPQSITVLDKDCWTVSKKDILDPVDIFLYDGGHTYEEQKKAITYFTDFLSEYSIILVDDWMCDWVQVREGTLDGLADSGLEIVYKEEIGLVNTTDYHKGGDTFWNGCGIFLCRRHPTHPHL